MSKIKTGILSGFCLLVSIWLPSTVSAITNTLPQIQDVYGGSIGAIDIIEPTGEANIARMFVSTEFSANSVFYADVNHTLDLKDMFTTNNFRFRVIPDFDAQANFGTVNGIAAHEDSSRLFVADNTGLFSCTTNAGSLVTNISYATSPGAGVLAVAINDSTLLALASSNNSVVLYFGALDVSGNFTQGSGSPIAVGLSGIQNSSDIGLCVNPSNTYVYVIDSAGTNGVRKSSVPCTSLSGSATFSTISLPSQASSWSGNKRLGFGPEGRMFAGGADSTNKVIAYSGDDGTTWTVVNTTVGGTVGDNIRASYNTNLYGVLFGGAVSTNKGEAGSWRSIGYNAGPLSTHANDSAAFYDPILDRRAFYCSSDQGIGCSTNGGATIFEIDYGLEAVAIQDFDMTADKTLAWTASKSGLRRGAGVPMALTWMPDGTFPTGDGSPYYSIAIDKDDATGGNTVYAGNGNVYKTTDGGTNWTRIWAMEGNTNGFPNNGYFVTLVANGQTIVAGFYSGSSVGGLLLSQDGGSNWGHAIANMDVNDIFFMTNSILVAAAYNATYGVGGIYNLSTSSRVREVSENVSVRCFATDSAGGIYACGQDTTTYAIKIYYKLLSDSSWTAITTNGLPAQNQMVSSRGPVMVVGRDSVSNDLPIILVGHTLYYLPSGGSTWRTSSDLTYPDGSTINVLYWDELMVGTSEGVYSQNITVQSESTPLAPTGVSASKGTYSGKVRVTWNAVSNAASYEVWRNTANASNSAVKFDTEPTTNSYDDTCVSAGYIYYYWVKAKNEAGTSGFSSSDSGYVIASLTGDIDGDGLADLISVVGTSWYVWFSSAQYLVRGGPYAFNVSGLPAEAALQALQAGTPVTGDIDGDGLADIIVVSGTSWYVWFSSAQYGVRGGPYLFDVAGTPVTGDIDGDGLADIIVVSSATGGWYVWFSSAQYLVRGGPYAFNVSGTPVTGDIDGDGLADIIVVSGTSWYVWFSSAQYLVRGGPYAFNVSGTPTTGDVDGDGLADIIVVSGTSWYAWFSSAQYLVRGGPYVMALP